MTKPATLPLCLLLALLLGACERPFVEAVGPELAVVEPDLSTVLLTRNVTLRVAATSVRSVQAVDLNGQPMRFVPGRDVWEQSVQLQDGLNTLVLAARDEDGAINQDTAFAVVLPFRFVSGPALPEARGGHTATLLPDGRLLVTGGAARAGGPAQPDAFLLTENGTTFVRLPGGLNEARTGHTATLLPDGRVLLVGGSRTDAITSVNDLVESVELFDPDTQRFVPLPFGGQPIRRALHTASLRTETILDLYGGRGDIRYTPEPRLGTRSDLRSFRLTPDSLLALNTLFGAPDLVAALSGHSQTALAALPPGEAASYLISGTFFDPQLADQVSFTLDFSRPPQIFLRETRPLHTPRTRHAAAFFREGFVGLFGGHQETPARTLDQTEVYVDAARRYFHLPATQLPFQRYAHTATKLPSGRILLVGGFTAGGNSVPGSEFFEADFLN